ncbi:hypothetical protein V6N12_024664 [Hibiscus sabdariffa]|uniref:Uncharacterized protein n=1 Tax=Hibiscus sabdariffa TaxID=183260 RepID=A0ABR2G1R8_9ROSI
MDQGLVTRVSEKLTQPITAMGSNVSSTVRCVCRCAREFFLRYVPSIQEPMRQRYPNGLTNLTPNSVRLMKKELAKCPQFELARLERGQLSLKGAGWHY